MAVGANLESKGVSSLLLQVSGLVESQDILRVCSVCVVLLVEEEQTLAGLAGPCNDGVRDLRLLTAEIEIQVLRGDGGVVEPKLLLRCDE